MRVLDLDPQLLGSRLLGVVPASRSLNHSYPKSTVIDYLDHSEPETEFISDLLNLPTEQLVEKWYGGEETLMKLQLESSPMATYFKEKKNKL